MTKAVLAVVCLLPALVLGQTPAVSQAQTLARNVDTQYERLRVRVTYDLPVADPTARFNVSLVVTLIATGETVTALAVTGDVGRAVAPTGKKTITWSAGNDIETPQFDLYRINVVAVPATGGLRVETVPAGATVTLDDETTSRGVTPLTIDSLTPGSHRVTVSLTGYAENFNVETVDAGATKTVSRALTSLAAPPGAGPGTVVPPKGGLPKWLLPAAGGGAAAAYLGLKKKPGTTTTDVGPCTFAISPTTFSNPTQGGGTTSVAITVTPDGCSPSTWQASHGELSNGLQMTVSALTGSGPQTITVTLPPNNTTTAATSTAAKIATRDFTLASPQPGLPSENLGITGASASFQSFSLPVVAGTKLTIAASGCIQTPSNGCVPPVGIGTNAGALGRLPGAPSFGLICGIPDQLAVNLFYAGPGSLYAGGATADRSGTLFCGLNAPDAGSYAGNTGSWSVTIVIGG